MKHKSVNKPFLISVIILAVAGFFIFSSASLGILARNEQKFFAIAFNQIFFGFILGTIAMIATSFIDFKVWKKFSPYLFLLGVILTLLVFIPGFGIEHGGAKRWVEIFGINFQPSEALKIGYIVYLSALYAKYKDKVKTFRYGLLPYIILTSIVGAILVMQPDNDTFFITALAGFAIFFVAGANWKHIAIAIAIGLVSFAGIVAVRPYVWSRVATFLHITNNPLSSGYQIKQSLVAIGSGGFMGKGFGQSTQKFNSLPEPMGDSIFAVASEEFGFVGSVTILLLFIFFAFSGLKIASKTDDKFGGLFVVGIVILIMTGSFINIGAMLGIIPLSGTPLLFISHGGTALFLTLAQAGIILNISKSKTRAT
ncbi:MAG: cell division protein FtsW [Patescibacteria group bacterium]|jgi:cell division protein FtsW|nr:cell division protein FtsW [Patescibacteria group bacterium]